MKRLMNRVFPRRASPHAAPLRQSTLSSELTTSDVEEYYLRIISECLRRLLVPADMVEIKVKRTRMSAEGLPGYAGCVRVVRWDPVATPVLLQNMPVVDARVRQLADASVILENTHFAGLWFQATSSAQGAPRVLTGFPAEVMHQAG